MIATKASTYRESRSIHGIRIRGFAAVTAAFLLVTGSAVQSSADPAPAADQLRDGLVAEYLFAESDGATLHNTSQGEADDEDPLNAEIQNYDPAQRSDAGTLTFTGGAKTSDGNWVRLPDDLLSDAESATISMDVRVHSSMLNTNHFLWNIGNDDTDKYWFANARGPRSAITVESGQAEDNATGYTLSADRWHSVTAVIDAEENTLTYYTDGQRAGVAKTSLRPSDITQTMNTIGRAPYPDQLFRGEVNAFRVYDRALSDSEVVSLSEEDGSAHEAELSQTADELLAAVDLGDIDEVTADLDLFTLRGISWNSSNPNVISSTGEVNRPLYW